MLGALAAIIEGCEYRIAPQAGLDFHTATPPCSGSSSHGQAYLILCKAGRWILTPRASQNKVCGRRLSVHVAIQDGQSGYAVGYGILHQYAQTCRYPRICAIRQSDGHACLIRRADCGDDE